MESWTPLDALAGKRVTALAGKNSVKGKVAGIDETGALLVKARNGRVRSVNSGDVTLHEAK